MTKVNRFGIYSDLSLWFGRNVGRREAADVGVATAGVSGDPPSLTWIVVSWPCK